MKLQNLTIPATEKLSLFSNLSTMISAGIPIIPAVNSLIETRKGNARKILEEVRSDLLAGKQLHTSFSKFPRVFTIVMLNILKASEQAGTLDIALKDIKEQIKRDIEFNKKIQAAMLYPILVLIVFLAVMLLMFIVVMPNISKVFTSLKVTLPLPTKIMIFLSDILLRYTIPVIIGLILLVGSLILLYKIKRKWFISAVYSLPLISQVVREIDLTRFARSMHLLLSSGIMITNALELTEGMVVKKEVALGIKHAKDMVYAGKTLSTGFKDHQKTFPEIMVMLTEAGEKTGTLDRSMQDIAEHFDANVSDTLKTLSTVIEPVLLVVVGIFVGAMMLAIIAPIYGLIGNISPHH